MNNIAALLRTDCAIAARKVLLWVCMVGRYPQGAEYNVCRDASSAAYAFEDWPKWVLIVWTDWNYGHDCYSGRVMAELLDTGNPVWDTFAACLTPRSHIVPGARACDQLAGYPSWDATAVLIAARGREAYFNLERGRFRSVDARGTDVWKSDAASICGRATEKLPKAEIGRVLDTLMCRPALCKRCRNCQMKGKLMSWRRRWFSASPSGVV